MMNTDALRQFFEKVGALFDNDTAKSIVRRLADNVHEFGKASDSVDNDVMEFLNGEVEHVSAHLGDNAGDDPDNVEKRGAAAVLVGSLRTILDGLPVWLKSLLTLLEEFLKLPWK